MNHGEQLDALRGQLQDMQALLARSEKMATLGGLTAGIAHEINNPIGFVKNNTLMLGEYLQVLLPVLRESLALAAEQHCPEGLRTRIAAASVDQTLPPILDDIEPLLRDTLGGIQQLEAIAAGLRRFARHDLAEGEDVDLNQCLRDALEVAWNRLKYRAKVTQNLAAIPTIRGRPGDIRHVILNLLLAAARTLPDFGEIRVRTDRLDGEVRLLVTSDGPELHPEDLERLLTPRLAGPAVGDGDWPGLSISREMVAAHGGRIGIASAPGEGVEFSLFIPFAPEVSDDHIG